MAAYASLTRPTVTKPLRRSSFRFQRRQHFRRRHRQAVKTFAERVMDGVGDRGHDRHQRHLADALDALRMLRVRHLDHHGVEHRQIRAHRHAIIEEAWIIDLAIPVVDVLFVERDRKSTRLNSSHEWISYAVFCLKKKKKRSPSGAPPGPSRCAKESKSVGRSRR